MNKMIVKERRKEVKRQTKRRKNQMNRSLKSKGIKSLRICLKTRKRLKVRKAKERRSLKKSNSLKKSKKSLKKGTKDLMMSHSLRSNKKVQLIHK
jgi:hypothetical protein